MAFEPVNCNVEDNDTRLALDTIDRNFVDTQAQLDAKVGGGGTGAPDSAPFITYAADATLSAERVLGVGAGGSLAMTSAGSAVTLRRSALTGDVTAADDGNATTIANDAVTFAKMQNIPTDSLIGRDTAGTGDPESITLGTSLSFSGAQVLRRAALTGDVTASVDSNATTIAAGVVTLAKMANIATDTLIGRDTAGTGVPEAITLDTSLMFTGTGKINTIQDIRTTATPTFQEVYANTIMGAQTFRTVFAGGSAGMGAGDILYDSTAVGLFGYPGSSLGRIGVLVYANTADSNAIFNTAAETDFNTQFTFTGSPWAATGTVLFVRASGEYGTDSLAIPQLRIRGYIGSGLVFDSGSSQVSISNQRWQVWFYVHITSGLGVSRCQGYYDNNRNRFNTSILTPTLTLGSVQTIKLSGTWSAADLDNTATVKLMEIWVY